MNPAAQKAFVQYLQTQAPILYLLLAADGTILEANALAQELSGEALAGVPVGRVIETFGRPIDFARLAACPEQSHRFTVSHASGLPQSYFFNFYPGDPGCVIALGRLELGAITQLQENLLALNQQLNTLGRELHQKSARLAQLNESKNELLGTAAHDLRNPLSVILGYSSFLLKSAAGFSPTQVRYLSAIEKASRFMLELINDLLDVTKIEMGVLKLKRCDTDLRALLAHGIEMNQAIAAQKSIRIQLAAQDPLPLLSIDATRIEQVLNNLLSNAIMYSFPDTLIRVGVRQQDDQVRVDVADQGQGIPEAEQRRIFEAFATTSTRGTAGETSTGLGLAIARKIVLAHGGRIWLESQPGQGATFSFSLPIPAGARTPPGLP